MKKIIVLFSLILPFAFTVLSANEPWKQLFNGKDFTGWHQIGGKAAYSVENGEVVGKTVLNTENSFMVTDLPYSDFILEFEVKVDDRLNSGVQIRSNSIPTYKEGRFHGYQIEIDPSERAWSGGIYDEARRGWLYPLTYNQAGQKAFKNNDWNKYRVEAIGNHIQTWINDIPCANLWDDVTAKGFIGLQVHSVGKDPSKENIEVRWRNIRIISKKAAKFSMKNTAPEVNRLVNTLTENEKKDGWKLLFDGKTSTGWRGVQKESFPVKGWKISEGSLTVLPSNGSESQNGGDIVTNQQYANFELQLEFKITPGANSGIKYFVTEKEKTTGSAIGLEYQILDDNLHPDAKLGNHDGSRTVASLYDLIKAENKRFAGVGEWNQARIISNGKHVEHWLNGIKVLEYERGSEEFRKLVSESKYKTWENFGEAEKGCILLQDHGNEVSFRSIKIKEID